MQYISWLIADSLEGICILTPIVMIKTTFLLHTSIVVRNKWGFHSKFVSKLLRFYEKLSYFVYLGLILYLSCLIYILGKEGKKRKNRSGSNSSSAPGSRSGTPIPIGDGASDTLSQAAKSLKDSELTFKCTCHEAFI